MSTEVASADRIHSSLSESKIAFISADQSLPEITVKAFILSIFLIIILAAANAYLGLKLGNTVSASIPAAVISMGVLRLFRKSNILENNIVQTAASSGEALVGGIAYILPALIIIHYWQQFNYWETVLIAGIGGIFGVLFSVPLRRVLLSQKTLRFPEGTAIGEVLKASTTGGASLKYIILGSSIGGIISFLQAGLQILAESSSAWFKSANNIIYGASFGYDPALLAAGYIIGINVALAFLLGDFIGWIAGIPVLTHIFGIPQVGDASSVAMDMWRSHIRYIGVGTMLVGGLWTLFTLAKPIAQGLYTSMVSVKAMRAAGAPAIPRTEQDIPIHYAFWCGLILLVPLGFLLFHFVNTSAFQFGSFFNITAVVFGIVFIIIAGFTFSAIGGYFAGLLGSTNSPASSLTISALLLSSLALLFITNLHSHGIVSQNQMLSSAALAIIMTSILAAGVILTNETIQDLKAGQIVGATPWKQQVMLILGTIVAAITLPFILQLLFNAYGIGGVFPHPGMDPSQMLAAPQAGLMATLAQGVFAHQLPWGMLGVGGAIAVICILVDSWLRTKGTRLPTLAVGLAIYIPMSTTVPVIIGGVASFVIEQILLYRTRGGTEKDKSTARSGRERGLILACGIVAGAALMGVILAIPFAIAQSTDVLKLAPASFAPFASVLAIAAITGLLVWIGYVVCKKE